MLSLSPWIAPLPFFNILSMCTQHCCLIHQCILNSYWHHPSVWYEFYVPVTIWRHGGTWCTTPTGRPLVSVYSQERPVPISRTLRVVDGSRKGKRQFEGITCPGKFGNIATDGWNVWEAKALHGELSTRQHIERSCVLRIHLFELNFYFKIFSYNVFANWEPHYWVLNPEPKRN